MKSVFCVGLITIFTVGAAEASSIAIGNFSFEALSVSSGNYVGQNVPGWTFTGFVSTYHPSVTEIPSGAPDGSNIASVAGGASISQVLTATLQANTEYILTAGVGERTDIGAGGYLITLLAGTTVLASDSSQQLTPGGFVFSTLNYFAGASDQSLGQALTINVAAQSLNGITGTGQTEFDNFKLSSLPTGVPEPASLALFTAGFCLIALACWSQTKRYRVRR